jgi:hypothetical protein
LRKGTELVRHLHLAVYLKKPSIFQHPKISKYQKKEEIREIPKTQYNGHKISFKK